MENEIKEIKLVLPDEDSDYALKALIDRHKNLAILNEINNICRNVMKYDADPLEAIKEIRELSFRDY